MAGKNVLNFVIYYTENQIYIQIKLQSRKICDTNSWQFWQLFVTYPSIKKDAIKMLYKMYRVRVEYFLKVRYLHNVEILTWGQKPLIPSHKFYYAGTYIKRINILYWV